MAEDIFEERGEDYWRDIKGIVELLNNANSNTPVHEFTSPIITNYLLWRMLFELKSLNIKMKMNIIKNGPTDKEQH